MACREYKNTWCVFSESRAGAFAGPLAAVGAGSGPVVAVLRLLHRLLQRQRPPVDAGRRLVQQVLYMVHDEADSHCNRREVASSQNGPTQLEVRHQTRHVTNNNRGCFGVTS